MPILKCINLSRHVCLFVCSVFNNNKPHRKENTEVRITQKMEKKGKTIPLRSILIMSSHLHLDLPKGLFPVGVPVKLDLFKCYFFFDLSSMRDTSFDYKF